MLILYHLLFAEELTALGLTKIKSGAIKKWHSDFRIAGVLPHPGKYVNERESNGHIRIFEYFPRAKEMFLRFAEDNKDELSGKVMAEEFAKTILPELERESREKGCFDDGSPAQKLLVKQLAKPPGHGTIVKSMHHLNITWDPMARQRGRDGTSYQSIKMKEVWAAGKVSTIELFVHYNICSALLLTICSRETVCKLANIAWNQLVIPKVCQSTT